MPILDFPLNPVEGTEWEDSTGLVWLFFVGAWIQIGGHVQEVVGIPVGAIIPYGGVVVPDGWFACDGAAISREDYADLFAVIGETFGTGDGSSSFHLPDAIGRVLSGPTAGHPVGTTAGSNDITISVDNLPAHDHAIAIDAVDNHGHSGSFTGGSVSGSVTGNTGSGGSHSHTVNTRSASNLQTDQNSGHSYGAVASTTTSQHNGHTHSMSGTITGGTVSGSVSVGNGGAHGHSASSSETGGDAPITVLQPTLFVYQIIKY